ncbi:hypothetical protein PFISCL1PPCAC_20865, partial [Pristionchus fissidentatus]
YVYSVPLMAIATGHLLVSGNSYLQFTYYMQNPSGQALQHFAVAKNSENLITLQQILFAFYLLAIARAEPTIVFKAPCSILDKEITQRVINALLIVYMVFQLIDLVLFLVQNHFLHSLRAKYESIEGQGNSEDTKPAISNVASSNTDLQVSPSARPPAPLPEQTATDKACEKTAVSGPRSKIRTALATQSISKKNNNLQEPTFEPTTMSFKDKDMGYLKEVER